MRSSPVKVEKKPAKLAARRAYTIKKKKLVDMKPPIRDTISETISFVIKGKLTPIKPILIDNKYDILGRTNKKLGKVIKKKNSKVGLKPAKQIIKKPKQKTKPKTKVQIETAKKPSAQNSIKKSAEKPNHDVIPHTPKEVLRKSVKSEIPNKITKNKIVAKSLKVKKSEVLPKTVKPKVKTEVKKTKKRQEEPNQKEPEEECKTDQNADEIKKQQTIEELLKQVNEELIENKKAKKQKAKAKKESGEITKEKIAKKIKEPESIIKKAVSKKSSDKKVEEPKVEKDKDVEIPDEMTLKEVSQIEDKTSVSTPQIKTEPISDEEVDVKVAKKTYKKLKTEPKMTIMKKRVLSKNKNQNDLQKCTTKLFGFWNGPKRHRVASLNALAKVHCLYENETRGNMLDVIEESSKSEYASKKENSKAAKTESIKKETDSDDDNERSSSPLPTRTLRSVPGLRGMGKHWDMHDTSSSSSEETSDEDKYLPLKEIKKEKLTKPVVQKDTEKSKQERKRNRKQNELMMDLKDMVVRKRMASLNASAILAASYSVERRQTKTVKSDGDSSDSYDGSSEEYFAASDTEIKQEDDVKKEEDRKLIEVHTTPNKKVAVILNQDTDVTITGVYVNSTTRSTHHEGYCSIAGMQYRISATSHTQTAATAVATETLLQSSSNSGPDNSNSDSMPSSKSYTPLDALSNMQPPPGPGIQHNHPVIQQPHMGPPQHVLPMPPHQLSPGLRHSCSSAFSSPHSTPTYQLPPGHHPPETGYVHAGYYQPAGPLITVPHGGHAPPPPAPLSKSAPLSESSPTSTTPSLTGHDATQAPTSNRDGGDSSDSEVIITSVTTAKDPPTPLPPPPPHPSYRYAQYPPTPPYSYPHYPPYHYPTPPPASYGHHELCYSYKYPYSRRYLAQYYPPGGVQEVYPPSGQSQQSQQVVPTPAPATSNPSSGAPFGSSAPPPPIMDPYPPPPQPTLVEPYQPPHYYPPPGAFGPAPPPSAQCYGHAGSTRGIPFINTAYQSCPCPMQSCPKNVLTGPLTGDSKRSNIASISKDSMPLPPVALALPLEPASETGPPSPARGSAGMPPPPSPAGATYQPPPPPTKQESQATLAADDCKKRKARIGKAMVRNNIAAGMQNNQQNTMLLMCNPTQNFAVKREIESPKEKEIIEEKKEECCSDEEVKPTSESLQVPFTKPEEIPVSEIPSEPVIEPKEEKITEEVEDVDDVDDKENTTCIKEDVVNEVLPPVVSTVAENVKVKNMKRKLSLTKEKVPEPEVVSPKKKQKLSSYKMLIKKDTNSIKINNGKRKLIEDPAESPQTKRSTSKSKKPTKRKLSLTKEENGKRLKVAKPLADSNATNAKQTSKIKTEIKTEDGAKKVTKKLQVNSKISKSAPAVLDSLITKNSIDRTIESVISEVSTTRTSKDISALKPAVSKKVGKESASPSTPTLNNNNNNNNKKSTNKNVQSKIVKSECKKSAAVSKRKTKNVEVVVAQPIMKVPRRSLQLPRWSNGWRWEGESYEAKVFINSDEMTVVRRCYPAMMHETGDKIVLRDCVLLKAGPRKNDLPFVAKIAALWENPEDGEMMMSLLWYYRPEHTEQGRLPTDQPDEVFASRHKDSNSVACIDDKCYVLTFNEYCRYRKRFKRMEEGIEETLPCIPNPEPYPRIHRQPPSSQISPEMVFFCRRVYDFRQKRIMKNPT